MVAMAAFEICVSFFETFWFPTFTFLLEVVIFLKTEMDNPTSNFTYNEVQYISIELY